MVTAERRHLGYLPWMDGMRAVAVLAVMVYHEMISQPGLGIQRHFNGGLLGVDIFFAISGFLITSLLLQEAPGIRFRAFYVRRIRRLVPALTVLLLVVTAVALFGEHGHHRIRTLEHVATTIGYAGNWAQAFDKSGMHELGQTWSLAIEEQFYIVWPAILAVLLVLARAWRGAVVAGIAYLTLLSVWWLELAADRHWSFMRVYYGLDTRASSLAFGALLGGLYVYGMLPRGRVIRVVRIALALAGVWLIQQLLRQAGYPILYVVKHGHRDWADYARFSIFPLVALATTLIIWELVESPRHIGHRILGWGPLVAIGRISYGLYLWDGTLTAWLTNDSVGLDRWNLVALRTVLAFAAATASWFLVERRFRARRAVPTG